jgi:hypothetical protein
MQMTIILRDDAGFTHPVQLNVTGEQAASMIAKTRAIGRAYGVTHPVPVKVRSPDGTFVSL